MKPGYLSQFFSGVAVKRLSAVEANPSRSNQHEFNGVNSLKRILGSIRNTYDTTFIYLSDNDDEPVVDSGTLTWYDSRENNPERSAEHRLYFPTTAVSICAAEGDVLVIGKQSENSLLCLIVQGGSTIASQVLWLFRVDALAHHGFSVREELETEQDRLQFASTVILEQLGIAVETTNEDYLELMLTKFSEKFPSTASFSMFARSTVDGIDPAADPDGALMAWIEKEEILFRTLEKHLIAERLRGGFDDDVEGFLSFSLSVQNRRKSRAGLALENHLEHIFISAKVLFKRAGTTEGRSRPDFLFPGVKEYHNERFDSANLTMLGAKATCKDRWRQVLAEANRIKTKHLLTLEPSISTNQTDEMQRSNLQLILPRELHNTYATSQKTWLLDVAGFIDLIHKKQKQAGLLS